MVPCSGLQPGLHGMAASAVQLPLFMLCDGRALDRKRPPAMGVPACSVCAQGDTIRIVWTQTATHYGRFELRVCPLSEPSMLTEYSELSEGCLAAHQLLLAPNATQARVGMDAIYGQHNHPFRLLSTRVSCTTVATCAQLKLWQVSG